jgi:UDP-N-acetylglucosamine transferase subunit ALG13
VARIAVLLGTDHHPFERLVRWVADLSRVGDAEWFVQHGSTTLPASLTGCEMLTADALTELLEGADAVVTHGGPGLIMEAREAGHLPIVVPRSPRLHEHVDDHQLRFAEHIATAGLAVVAHTKLELRLALLPALLQGRAPHGLARKGADPSDAFGALVARVLAGSTGPTDGGRPR